MIKSKVLGALLLGGALVALPANAGNEDRAGSAGAQQLLINPWARSSAWADAGVSSVRGLESMYINVAGLAFTEKTEIMFARTSWLQGSGISINNIGIAQRIGETSVLGIGVMSMNYGDIPITTVDNPEGNIGNFNPSTLNFGISFAKAFSNSIYGGITVKAISERISNVSASGISFDAGIRYVTGEEDNIKFGITLKNVGPPMTYGGDGLSYTINQEFLGVDRTINVEQKASKFELPSCVNIGVSYDFLFGETQKFTLAGTFQSNSFTKDQIRLGGEYTYNAGKAAFIARAGYTYEKGIFNELDRTTAFTGPSAGLSVDFAFGESKSKVGIDYSYRTTNFFGGVHNVGVRIGIN